MLKDKLIRWFSRPVLDRFTNVGSSLPFTLATDIGLQRAENQDRVGAMRVHPASGSGKPFTVIALADGMGGMRDGAGCAVRALAAFFENLALSQSGSPKYRLECAANAANSEVYAFSAANGGATLSAVYISGEESPVTVNVGDSRIYASSQGSSDHVVRLTIDDSLEEAVGGHGRELLQFIGMGDGMKAHIAPVSTDMRRLLITSDGVHFINHDTLCEVFRKAPDIYRVTERLAALARWCGAPDNASLAAVDLADFDKNFSNSGDPEVIIWDPFSSVNIVYTNQNSPIQPSPKVGAAGRRPSESDLPKQVLEKENQPTKVPKKRKPRKSAKESKLTLEGPQLVIEIDNGQDSTVSEKNGGNSE